MHTENQDSEYHVTWQSNNAWIKSAWRREVDREENSTVTESVSIMHDVGVELCF